VLKNKKNESPINSSDINPTVAHTRETELRVDKLMASTEFNVLSNKWNQLAIRLGYPMNFSWLGRPIIQCPPDIYAIQELIYKCRPDLIIETGVAHGGSLILSASMLLMLEIEDHVLAKKSVFDLKKISRRVIGIDIDIRKHNKDAIDLHYLREMIELVEGSSVSPKVTERVLEIAKSYKRVMVMLDSNHTHDHVLRELQVYAPLVTAGQYCIVWDTGIEDLPSGFVENRPWGPGDNPMTAVFEYLKSSDNSSKFEIDKKIESKIGITASPNGFLRRI
jgi:cephalosporin hydroxylase